MLDAPLQSISTDRLIEMRGLIGASSGAVALSGDFECRLVRGQLIIGSHDRSRIGAGVKFDDVILSVPGKTLLSDGRTVECSVEPFDRGVFDEHCATTPYGTELLDADRIVGQLRCRPRCRGDRFSPLGCGGSQNVGDFLTNLKLSACQRENTAIIFDDMGVVYVAPQRIDNRVKMTNKTASVLRIEWSGS